jgi:type IV pilus assembly protein PilO
MRLRFREFIFLAVLLGVPASSYLFVFRPQNNEISQARAEILHKEQMLSELSEVLSQTKDLEALNLEIKSTIDMIEARLPSAKEVDVVLGQVAEIALGHDLVLEKVKSNKPLTAAAYMEQPLEMVITGDFEGFYSFLLDLEQLDRITRMPKLDIKRSSEMDGDMKAEFTLSIYFESGDGDEL